VRPGDVFEMVIENMRASSTIVKQSGKGYVNGELAIEAHWLCMVGADIVPENLA
jgi:3-hydroxyacyl-[acyl-carrier-protein] dehydratase